MTRNTRRKKTLNGCLPIKQGPYSRETPATHVSDDWQHKINRRRKKIVVIFRNFDHSETLRNAPETFGNALGGFGNVPKRPEMFRNVRKCPKMVRKCLKTGSKRSKTRLFTYKNTRL